MTRKHDIAIIGIGGDFPDAKDAKTFWNNILDGHVAIREVTDDRWESDLFFSEDRNYPDKTYSKIGGFIGAPPFDRKTFRIAPKVVEQRQQVCARAVDRCPHTHSRHQEACTPPRKDAAAHAVPAGSDYDPTD